MMPSLSSTTRALTLALTILFHAPTLTSAIDIKLYSEDDCTGTFLRCGNAEPDECCTVSPGVAAFSSAGFHSIPREWTIRGFIHWAADCEGTRTGHQYKDTTDFCIRSGTPVDGGSGPASGMAGSGSYVFAPLTTAGQQQRKDMVRGERSMAGGAEGGERERKCRRAEGLVLGDGTEYDVSQLDDEAFNEMVRRRCEGVECFTRFMLTTVCLNFSKPRLFARRVMHTYTSSGAVMLCPLTTCTPPPPLITDERDLLTCPSRIVLRSPDPPAVSPICQSTLAGSGSSERDYCVSEIEHVERRRKQVLSSEWKGWRH